MHQQPGARIRGTHFTSDGKCDLSFPSNDSGTSPWCQVESSTFSLPSVIRASIDWVKRSPILRILTFLLFAYGIVVKVTDELWPVQLPGKYAYIDHQGQMVIPAKFGFAWWFWRDWLLPGATLSGAINKASFGAFLPRVEI